MPNSSYSIYAANDGSGNFTPTTRRNPTAASGGTTLTIPAGEEFPGSTTKLLYLAIDAGKRRILNDYTQSAAATRSYSIDVVNDGSDNYTTTVRYNPTAPSGGTTLTLPTGELFPGTSTKLLYLAIDAPKRRILDDRAAGN
jgi:hypothetical protein